MNKPFNLLILILSFSISILHLTNIFERDNSRLMSKIYCILSNTIVSPPLSALEKYIAFYLRRLLAVDQIAK